MRIESVRESVRLIVKIAMGCNWPDAHSVFRTLRYGRDANSHKNAFSRTPHQMPAFRQSMNRISFHASMSRDRYLLGYGASNFEQRRIGMARQPIAGKLA